MRLDRGGSSTQLQGASIVRFIAASMVVAFHVALMPMLQMPPELSFITSYGGFGVPLFYMLSAFALCYGYFGRLETGDQMRRFYVRRFWRIAPLFYAMMVYYFAFLWIVTGRPVSLTAVAASATFTFNLMPQHVTGFVFASWSIGVEMLFYAVFPVLVLLVTNIWRAAAAFALAVLINPVWHDAFVGATGALQQFGTFSLVAHLHYFAAGILAYFVWREIRWNAVLHRSFAGMAMLGLLALVFVSPQLHGLIGRPLTTAVWAVAFVVLILGLSFEQASPRLQFAVRLGEASFSLYLLHPAIIALMMKGGVYEAIYSAVPGAFAGYLASLAVTVAMLFPLSIFTYHQIERRFYVGARKLPASTRQAVLLSD